MNARGRSMLRMLSLSVLTGLVASVAAGPSPSPPEPPSIGTLRTMHDDAVLAFVDSRGFGMTRLPAMAPMLRKPVAGTPWFVADLTLIGVAKHHPPRAFGGALSMDVFHRPSDEMPLRRSAGRAITAAESRALHALDAGERLVVVPEGGGLRVTGAIRAADECLGCHTDKRAGDMLGAFVYLLQPVETDPR